MATHKVLSTKKLDPSLIKEAEQNRIKIIEQEAIKVNPIVSKEKWQEIFQVLETATDKCEDAANVIESIIVKYA